MERTVENIKSEIESVLKRKASNKELVSYKDLCIEISNSNNFKLMERSPLFFKALREIAKQCIDKDQPILTSIVVRAGKKTPGDGYFKSSYGRIKSWKKDCKDVYSYKW